MDKFTRLTEKLCTLPPGAALHLSGGKDSLLLLKVLTTFELEFSVLRFDLGWSRGQRSIVDELIKEHDLTVYSYPPASFDLFGDGNGNLAWSTDYALGSRGERLPVLRDIVPGDACAYDVEFPASFSLMPKIYFTNHITGAKKGETHFALGGKDAVPGPQFRVGDITIHCPLYDWTDAEVIEALKLFFGIDYKEPSDALNTGNTSVCTRCMHGVRTICPKKKCEIDPVKWDPVANLNAWRSAREI